MAIKEHINLIQLYKEQFNENENILSERIQKANAKDNIIKILYLDLKQKGKIKNTEDAISDALEITQFIKNGIKEMSKLIPLNSSIPTEKRLKDFFIGTFYFQVLKRIFDLLSKENVMLASLLKASDQEEVKQEELVSNVKSIAIPFLEENLIEIIKNISSNQILSAEELRNEIIEKQDLRTKFLGKNDLEYEELKETLLTQLEEFIENFILLIAEEKEQVSNLSEKKEKLVYRFFNAVSTNISTGWEEIKLFSSSAWKLALNINDIKQGLKKIVLGLKEADFSKIPVSHLLKLLSWVVQSDINRSVKRQGKMLKQETSEQQSTASFVNK